MKIPYWIYIAAFVLGFILLIASGTCQMPKVAPTTTTQGQ